MRRRADPLFALAAVLLIGVAALGVIEASGWVGRTFTGFLVLENRVVASAGLSRWPATRGGEIYQHEVHSMDGAPVASARALHASVAKLPPGTVVEYGFRRGPRTVVRRIATRRFSGQDFVLLYGSFLISGLALAGAALAIRYLRPRDATATGSALSLGLMGLWALTAMDLYGPYRIFRLHAFLECLLFAAALHLALVFPYPRRSIRRRPWLIGIPYAAAALLGLVQQTRLHDPAHYAATHLAAMSAVGAAIAVLVALQVASFVRPPHFEARQRVKVLVLGTLATFTPHLALLGLTTASGGGASENLMGWSGAFFPIAIGYAVIRNDLLGVDAILRRSVGYVFLTAVVALGFVGAMAGVEALIDQSLSRGRFALLFSAVAALVILPLRDRLQATLDRLFFRSAYDFRRLVERTSARLASAAELAFVSREIESAVREALQPTSIDLGIRREPERGFEPVEPDAAPSPALAAAPNDLSERQPFDLPGGGLAVPFWIEDRLLALLVIGRRRSGRVYGGDDRRLLHTLSHQGAVAIENALALERLRVLNRDLEQKVEERTSELEVALCELRETQSQLVHQEKMASLGQLVAGVAHEINNPLNFVQGNLHVLRDYTKTLAEVVEAFEDATRAVAPELRQALARIREASELGYVLGDLESAFSGCQEGVERATTILRDLRTFSRVDSAKASRMDVNEALDSTLSLLGSRLKGIHVVREYSELPPVECLAGPMNQVWMNLLANAADAVGEEGTITVRTRAFGDVVRVEVEDDGCGISREDAERIFEPFFTTKSVGKGTGLGLSVSYGVVTRHAGRIAARSEPGRGACFTVELPVHFVGEAGEV